MFSFYDRQDLVWNFRIVRNKEIYAFKKNLITNFVSLLTSATLWTKGATLQRYLTCSEVETLHSCSTATLRLITLKWNEQYKKCVRFALKLTKPPTFFS